ncbi:galactosylceramide sulfotransferase-like, partial [Dermacentor variabilis]|uniref:galactosylceramide sulfotransferase-like n=1 Tax=Dermacentor variabilis TaxID=34621 RepID=UPI003F5BBCD8
NRSVCFLKMHKCASSSVQNVLMRYGEVRNMTFALPSRGNLLGYPRAFKRTMAAVGKPPFDFLAHHTRFNESEMRAVLKPDVVFVTIVREPAALFESLYSYFDYEKRFHFKLERLPNVVRNASQRHIVHGFFPGPHRDWLGFDQMSFDLGFDFTQADNVSAVDAFIEHVDAVFDLVMVVERLNESLVLLRDLLCWEVDDVVMFKINARRAVYQRPPNGTLAADLRSLNALDVKLYEYFTRRFDERVQVFGRARMRRELRLLKQRTEYWYQQCDRRN